MSDNLSQDELDKLLAGMEEEGAGDDATPGASLSNDEFAKLEVIFSEAWAKLAANMAQSLGQDVHIDFGVAAMVTEDGLSSDVEGLGIFVHYSVTGAGDGHHGIVMQKEEVAKLGALMAGDDPATATLTADNLQGVLDLLDMSLPIVTASLSEALGETIEFGGVEAVNAEDPSGEFDAAALGLSGSIARLEYALAVGDAVACPMLYTLPLAHARDWAARAPELVAAASAAEADTAPFAEFESAQAAASPAPASGGSQNLDLILDIELEVVARLGSIQMPIREILKLGPGAILDIDRPADAPVDLVVNDKLVARGDIVVVQENFGLKVSEVQSAQERIASLRP